MLSTRRVLTGIILFLCPRPWLWKLCRWFVCSSRYYKPRRRHQSWYANKHLPGQWGASPVSSGHVTCPPATCHVPRVLTLCIFSFNIYHLMLQSYETACMGASVSSIHNWSDYLCNFVLYTIIKLQLRWFLMMSSYLESGWEQKIIIFLE